MKGRPSFSRLYLRLVTDKRITAWHVSLYIGIFHLWELEGNQNTVAVTRRKLMQLARMQSCMTYHKCINQLQDFGFIKYEPSYHPSLGSRIELLFAIW